MIAAAKDRIHPYVYFSVISSLLIILGALWDFSWHISIGRDSIFAPPHDVMYLGAVFIAFYSGYRVLRVTFAGTAEQKQASVKFWGVFYGPMGALFSIWGALAMLTSAPFDNWWHSAYGIDIVILSPPHTLLAVGGITIQFGAMVTVLSSSHTVKGRKLMHQWLFVIATGLVMVTFFSLFTEFLNRPHSHSAIFYQISAIVFPLFLIVANRASGMRWGATAAAGVYMVVLLAMQWILPLFHCTPRLGPVLNHVTHYQPFGFPMLLVIPAFFIDYLFIKLQRAKPWVTAILAALAFLLVFFVVQWFFGAFQLTSPYARGWVFGSYAWYYGADPLFKYRYAYDPSQVDTGMGLVTGMLIAGVLAAIAGLTANKWSRWMKEVQR